MKSLKKMIAHAGGAVEASTTLTSYNIGGKDGFAGYDQTPRGSLADAYFFKNTFCSDCWTVYSVVLSITFTGTLSEDWLTSVTVEINDVATTFDHLSDGYGYSTSGGETTWSWNVTGPVTSGTFTCRGPA